MANLRVGSVTPRFVQTLSLSPSSVPANNMSLETYTVNGLTTDMLPVVQQQSLDDNQLRAVDCRVTAANTLEICWLNFKNASVAPAASQTVFLVCY